MRHHSGFRILCAIGLLVGSLALFGCPKRPEVMQAAPSAPGPVAAPMPAPAPPSPQPAAPPEVRVTPPPAAPAPAPAPPAVVVQETVKVVEVTLFDVFFDFDKSSIRDDQKAGMNNDVAALKADPKLKVLIEGHCDERGTVEYNLALGERRAKAAKDYLIAAGIPADRISTISYGKERPFVLGHDESAWKWNRRGHFVVQKM
jgi:peptidoglycan-associated lipoprotein